MADFSFDVVSKIDLNAIGESINIAQKEITNRYDFKGTNSTIELDQKNLEIKLVSSDEYKVKALYDVLITRCSKRNIAVKNFKPQKIESSLGGQAKQQVKLVQGISTEIAKDIVKKIKDSKLKVTPSIQGDIIRVSSRSKDALQQAMDVINESGMEIALQFENYR